MGTPWLYITVDEARGVALVRGPWADRVTWILSPTERKYSPTGRGWVIQAGLVPDVEAYANRRHEFVAVTRRKAAS